MELLKSIVDAFAAKADVSHLVLVGALVGFGWLSWRREETAKAREASMAATISEMHKSHVDLATETVRQVAIANGALQSIVDGLKSVTMGIQTVQTDVGVIRDRGTR